MQWHVSMLQKSDTVCVGQQTQHAMRSLTPLAHPRNRLLRPFMHANATRANDVMYDNTSQFDTIHVAANR